MAVVTGAARGIGREISRRLARDGAAVAALDLSFGEAGSAEQSSLFREEITRYGVKAQAYGINLNQPETFQGIVKQVLEGFGRIDILVNCAGVFSMGIIGEVEHEEFRRVMRVNLEAVFGLTNAIVRVMRPGGRVISISSSLVERSGVAGLSVYNASKAGVSMLTKSWAIDLAPKGILVNAVQPGHVNTDMNPETTEYAAAARERIPLRRHAQPREIAGAVSFFAGPDSTYITGSTLTVDGGLNA
ncbi:SDR family oxidoreductase [Paraburkholderia sp. LEh10]|uniref:SDR family NAD(P)-dependent oxidoreductase n=1 Tax=Paraburkholderia sp. LEh10 TaxID=2821353 RepID=UPI001AE9E879|nr:SDR family oxidoreductase [Paraburkholderia sp. LEh10]